jgi:hypothetical protein
MPIKIKGNSKIVCNVDIQKEVFWSTKNEDSGNYRYIEIIQPIGINEIIADIKAISQLFWRFKIFLIWRLILGQGR